MNISRKGHIFLAVSVTLSAVMMSSFGFAAEPDSEVLKLDKQFVHAAAAGDSAAMTKFLDKQFTWTDVDGRTVSAPDLGHAAIKPPLGDEADADVVERTYGGVGAVTAATGRIHVLRLWVKRPTGWKLIDYHAVKQLDQPSASGGSGVNECENPCKTIPYKPANDAERGIVASWQALETGVTGHDAAAWAPHIADEFVQVSSNSDHPLSKTARMQILDKQKASGIGSAPAPLVSAEMFDFGDAVIMTGLHQPYKGKPIHVSRLWIKRDGKWLMVISYQTTIEAGEAK